MSQLRNFLYFIMIFVIVGCINTKRKTEISEINSFFLKNSWETFNNTTLKKNNLSHFIDDDIDFFDRESFFNYMKKNPSNQVFDDFYLIEERIEGEKQTSIKIIVINYENKITYLGYKKNQNWHQFNISKDDKIKFRYENLSEQFFKEKDNYILITHIQNVLK